MTDRPIPGGIVVPGHPDFAIDFEGGVFTPSLRAEPILEPGGSVGVFYVDPDEGSNGNDGLAPESAFATLAKAREQPFADKIIRVKPGARFDQSNGFATSSGHGHDNLQIEPWGVGDRPVCTAGYAGLVWELVEGSTYAATLPDSNGARFVDRTNLTEAGDYERVTAASDLDACKATSNSWFRSGTTYYLNLFDGREPDDSVQVMSGAYNILSNSREGCTMYVEGIDFEGGSACVYSRLPTGSNVIMLKDCGLGYGFNNFEVNGGTLSILEDCRVVQASGDGLNYKSFNEASGRPTAIEIGCVIEDNGDGSTDQGSSMHTGGTVIRVNNRFDGNWAASVVDINPGTKSWNLGCDFGDIAMSDRTTILSEGSAQMWIDNCTYGNATNAHIGTNGSAVLNISGVPEGVVRKSDSTIRSYHADGSPVPLVLIKGLPA